MLISFKMKNYRSFKEEVVFTMEAEPSKLKLQNIADITLANKSQQRIVKAALIFGANASGKTNLIRAFYALINSIMIKPKVDDRVRMYDPFLFDKKTMLGNISFELVFVVAQSIKYEYKVIFNRYEIFEEILNRLPSGKNSNLFTRVRSSEPDIYLGKLGENFDNKEIKVFKNQLLLSKFGDDEPIEELTNIFKYFRNWDIINATNSLHRSNIETWVSQAVYSNPELYKKLTSLLKFADTKLQGFEVVNLKEDKNISISKPNKPFIVLGRHNLYDDLNDTGELVSLPFDNESLGTQVLYGLGGQLIQTLETGGVLIIDELDTSLHPFITRMILMMFQSPKLNTKNAQIIFTTHDVTLLDRDLVRRDQVWISEKKANGCSDLFSLQDFDGVREETAFDKWYLAGKFGGLPSIKSIDSIFEDE